MTHVERTTDPRAAARRILDTAARCHVPSNEVIGIIQTVAGYGSMPITRDHSGDKIKDRPAVAHEAAMYVGSGGAGVPYTEVIAEINSLIRAGNVSVE
jgi:hypothetical protein